MARKTNFWPLDYNITREKNLDKTIFYLNDLSSFDVKYSKNRFILKTNKALRPTELAKELSMSRTTIYSILKKLEEVGFMVEKEDRWEISPGGIFFKYFPTEYDKTVIYNVLPKDSLNILFYLANKFLYAKSQGCNSYIFSQGQLIREVWGLPSIGNSRSHNRIRSILNSLINEGYLQLDAKKVSIDEGYYFRMTGFKVQQKDSIAHLSEKHNLDFIESREDKIAHSKEKNRIDF